MRDPLRTKLDLILAAALAFLAGVGLTAALDLTPLSFAARGGGGPQLTIGAPPGTVASEWTAGFSQIAERINPAVVTIAVEQEVSPRSRARAEPERPRIPSPFDEFFDEFFEGPRIQPQELPPQRGTGSGFLVSSDGYIVTNNHVVEGADDVTVQLHDGREFRDVTVVGTDPTTDVALLKIGAEGLAAAPLGSSDSTRVGEWVLAIGSPGFQRGGTNLPGTVTAGIVSAKGRSIGILGRRFFERTGQLINPTIEDFIQTDAVINPGNSGGPLVNARGEVIGVNTAIFSTTGTYQGYGFAVPIELVREVIDDLIEYGEVRRAVIGVTVDEVNAYDAEYYGLERVAGVKVMDVGIDVEGGAASPAASAGIRPGDLILEVDGQPVQSVGDLQRKIRAHEPGDRVTLTVVKRDTKRTERVGIRLAAAESPEGDRPAPSGDAVATTALGLEVRALTPEVRSRLGLPDDVEGVVVTDVSARGPLYGQVDDGFVIVDVNGQRVTSPENYREIVAGLRPGDVVNLLVYNPDPRVRRYSVFTVPVPER